MFPLWSISVEEQFYLFAPWAVKTLNRNALTGFCAALIVIANLQLLWLGSIHAPDHAIWYNSFVQFDNFAAGILLCLFLRGRSPNGSLARRLIFLVGWALCWYFASFDLHIHAGGEAAPGGLTLTLGYGMVAAGCCSLLLVFLCTNSKLMPRWAVYLGRISYGMYVFHALALRSVAEIFEHYAVEGSTALLIRGVAALGLTVLIASLSYRYFETPFLRMKKRYEVVISRPV